MDIQIFVCDTAQALIHIVEEIDGHSDILYRTEGTSGETGDLIRCRVRPPRDPSTTIESFAGKFLVVAVRAD
jgi:hypothetical protein